MQQMGDSAPMPTPQPLCEWDDAETIVLKAEIYHKAMARWRLTLALTAAVTPGHLQTIRAHVIAHMRRHRGVEPVNPLIRASGFAPSELVYRELRSCKSLALDEEKGSVAFITAWPDVIDPPTFLAHLALRGTLVHRHRRPPPYLDFARDADLLVRQRRVLRYQNDETLATIYRLERDDCVAIEPAVPAMLRLWHSVRMPASDREMIKRLAEYYPRDYGHLPGEVMTTPKALRVAAAVPKPTPRGKASRPITNAHLANNPIYASVLGDRKKAEEERKKNGKKRNKRIKAS